MHRVHYAWVGYSNVLFALIFPQIFFQFKFFLPDPIKNDVKYQVGFLRSGKALNPKP